MTIEQVIEKVNSRQNPTTYKSGYLMRQDIVDALVFYDDRENQKDKIEEFLNNFSFLTEKDKKDILNDLNSYIY